MDTNDMLAKRCSNDKISQAIFTTAGIIDQPFYYIETWTRDIMRLGELVRLGYSTGVFLEEARAMDLKLANAAFNPVTKYKRFLAPIRMMNLCVPYYITDEADNPLMEKLREAHCSNTE